MEKIGSICILNRGGLPLKKGPLRIYGLIDVSEVSHCLGLSSPDFKCGWTAVYFFLGAWLYKPPSHGKDWVHLHFKSGRSTPKKRTPSHIWSNRRIWKYPII